MIYKRLDIWVEGPHDSIFFNNIIKDIFEEKGYIVRVREYNGDEIKGELMNKTVSKLINYLESDEYKKSNEKNFCPLQYIFVRDFDDSLSYNEKKEEITKIVKKIDKNKIVIVRRIIESWYISGLNRKKCNRLGIPVNKIKRNENITKNEFDQCIKGSKRSFLINIAKNFDIEIAKTNNNSFKYFIDFINTY